MAEERTRKPGWRERRKAAKQAKAQRTGDSPEKQADQKRGSGDADVKDAAGRASIGGTLSGGGF